MIKKIYQFLRIDWILYIYIWLYFIRIRRIFCCVQFTSVSHQCREPNLYELVIPTKYGACMCFDLESPQVSSVRLGGFYLRHTIRGTCNQFPYLSKKSWSRRLRVLPKRCCSRLVGANQSTAIMHVCGRVPTCPHNVC